MGKLKSKKERRTCGSLKKHGSIVCEGLHGRGYGRNQTRV